MVDHIEKAVRAVDRVQQRHQPTAFVFAVAKKFGDDRGGQLAGLIAFNGFLSFFPLTLVAITVAAFLTHGNTHLAEQLRTSALRQFPVVGADLAGGDRTLPGSGLGLAVGLTGLLWGGLGVTQALQHAFQEAWHVPLRDRPNFAVRLRRGLALCALLGTGVVATAILASLGSLIGDSLAAGVTGVAAATATSIVLALAVFWLLSPRNLRWVDLLPGAIVFGVGWQTLETIGVRLVQTQLRHASQLYGTVGVALGLISFLSLASQLTVYATEINSVIAGRLWPRSLLDPPLTEPDMADQDQR